MSMKEQKFRPALTLPQLRYLVQNLQQVTPAPELATLHTSTTIVLRTLEIKASAGAVTPAYTATPKESQEDKLGFALTDAADLKQLAYEKSLSSPQFCTPKELRLAATYRYENDLMTSEEESEFENGT